VLVHAQASRARVELALGPDEVRLEVHDDGSAGAPPTMPIKVIKPGTRPRVLPKPAKPAPDRLGGNGLIGMRERAVSCGGTLTIGTSPLGGWSVVATIPLMSVLD
jgi:signal transduction histidine kinase